MALLPYLLDEFVKDLIRPVVQERNNVAHRPVTDFIRDFSVPLRCTLRPWRDSGQSNVINDKDSFRVNLDVQQFKPDELQVKVADSHLVVEGKHEERRDEHGYISRQFTRKYRLPPNVDEKAVTSSLSSDGVLQLCAPKMPEQVASGRSIPIMQTAIKTKQQSDKMESNRN